MEFIFIISIRFNNLTLPLLSDYDWQNIHNAYCVFLSQYLGNGLWYWIVYTFVFCDRKKKSLDVKNAMRQLLNRYKKQLQENMHKVSKHISLLSMCTCT